MKWLKKIINRSCVCCGEIATKNVKEIPTGAFILYDLIKFNHLIVSKERFDTIKSRFYNEGTSYPLCNHCYEKVEAKWQEDKTKSDALKKEREVNEYYEKLALKIERKELEVRAKAIGIDLDKNMVDLNNKMIIENKSDLNR